MKKTAPKSKSRKPKRVFSWVNPKLEVRKSPIEGKGLFATADIKKGDVLLVMGGYIITTDDEVNCKNNFLVDNAIDLHENYSISPLTENQKKMMPQHYINHSCKPNCWIYTYCGHTLFFAIRNIKAGEELTISYLLPPKDATCNPCTHNCRCGSKTCTGTMHLTKEKFKKWQKFQDKEKKKTKIAKFVFGKNLLKLKLYPKIIPNNSIYKVITYL